MTSALAEACDLLGFTILGRRSEPYSAIGSEGPPLSWWEATVKKGEWPDFYASHYHEYATAVRFVSISCRHGHVIALFSRNHRVMDDGTLTGQVECPRCCDIYGSRSDECRIKKARLSDWSR